MKVDVEFSREMECKYVSKVGNTFKPIDIDLSIKRFTDLGIDKIPISPDAEVIIKNNRNHLCDCLRDLLPSSNQE